MAVSLKPSFQFFGVCNHQISSRYLHASAVFTAREIKKKKSSLGWPDIEDPRTGTTRDKVRERKLKSATLQKSSDSTKNKIREKRSASSKNTSKSKVNRERGSALLKKSSEGEGKAEVKAVPNGEVLKRRRAPEPVVCSARTAETMLLYKDDDILALNKPAGLAVHSGPNLRDYLSQHLPLWQYNAPSPPDLAHRLDKDTSGVLVLTRHAESAKRMAKLFHDKRIIKKYWAITVSVPENMKGSIKIPIGMKDVSEKKRGSHSMNRVVLRRDLLDDSPTTLPSNVHVAHTDYSVLSLSTLAPKRSCLLLVQPITGFKHQLRVHLADGLMCPVLGDYKFGGRLFRLSDQLQRKLKSLKYVRGYLYLHAAELEIPDYRNRKGKSLIIKAPPPRHFKQTAAILGLSLPHN